MKTEQEIERDIAALLRSSLSEFVETRKSLAAALRKEGEKEAAQRVLKVPKPSPVAWAINRAVFEDEAAIERLLERGRAVRELYSQAFRQGSTPKALAQVQRAEREATEGLVAELAQKLERDGSPLSAANLEKLRVSLSTIAITGRFGEEGRGLMTKELAAPKLDEVLEAMGEVALAREPDNEARGDERRATSDAGTPSASSASSGAEAAQQRAEEVKRRAAAEAEARRAAQEARRAAQVAENERATVAARSALAEHEKHLEAERRAVSHLTGRVEALRLEIGRLDATRAAADARVRELEQELEALRERIQALARERLAID